MHEAQMMFCEEVKRKYPNYFNGVKVLDIGSMDINGNNRHLFENSEYVGCDLDEGPNVDSVCCSHEYPAKPESLDVVISTETFEHDRYLEKTIKHAVSIIRPGGLFLFTCATGSREQHGTTNHKPNDSPYTNDHYQNVSEDMVVDVLDMEIFDEYEFRKRNGEDLYFYGVKKGERYENIEEWDWIRYLSENPDIVNAGITTDEDAYEHWLEHGKLEGRRLARK